MKKIQLFLSMTVLLAFFTSCTTDVELYSDYKDIPVIYGLLDASQDTNFIRIDRAFSGNNDNPINANEVALIADSCNYPGKLKAYIVEYKYGYGNTLEPTGDTVELDTITIHDKEMGVFYSPNQKAYFTDNMTIDHRPLFANNNPNAKFKYKLFVFKGDEVVTAETGLVGGDNFKILTSQLSFTPVESDMVKKITFTPADNAVFYDMKYYFTYYEKHDNEPETKKQVSFSFDATSIEDLGYEDNYFYFVYDENELFNLLETAIGADTVYDELHPRVRRYFDDKPIRITLAAGGDELYNYIKINSQSGYSQTVPDYTNIKGGFGVFSSRINLTKDVDISLRTQRGLYGKPWGFVEQ